MDATFIIKLLSLSPHPEGGYFRETYRSPEEVPAPALDARYRETRSISTAIYFLLTGDTFSSFHRLHSDEIWHFYAGDPVRLHLIYPDGRHIEILVGSDLSVGEIPQAVIPSGTWFAAKVENPAGYTLIGCTVAPGFDFADFELADRTALVKQFPHHEKIITSLTR